MRDYWKHLERTRGEVMIRDSSGERLKIAWGFTLKRAHEDCTYPPTMIGYTLAGSPYWLDSVCGNAYYDVWVLYDRDRPRPFVYSIRADHHFREMESPNPSLGALLDSYLESPIHQRLLACAEDPEGYLSELTREVRAWSRRAVPRWVRAVRGRGPARSVTEVLEGD